MRDADTRAFLEQAGWHRATTTVLAGDASSRRYIRLRQGPDSAILMDAGDGSASDLARFVRIATHLGSLNLSSPRILSQAQDRFLLLEDLGDAIFAVKIASDPSLEVPLYKAALDALCVVQDNDPPADVPLYGPAEMATATDLAFQWYAPQSAPRQEAIVGSLHRLLELHLTGRPVLCLRDLHAENLIWLPKRHGAARAGLLDFQDAVICHPAYDIASLLIDARRDVSVALRGTMIGYFAGKTGKDVDTLTGQVSICSAQRNLRILGIFARLARRDRKPGYADMLPRVWSNFARDLAHPSLASLRSELLSAVPAPTPAQIAALKGNHVTS